jgi:protein SCO1/2
MRKAVLLFALCLFMVGSLAHAQPPAGHPGGPFELIDQNGKPFSSTTLTGQPYAVFFGFTNCPDVCPTTLLTMSNAGKARRGRRSAEGAVRHRRPRA